MANVEWNLWNKIYGIGNEEQGMKNEEWENKMGIDNGKFIFSSQIYCF